VRIVAATNRDLKAEVAARRFRDDLYFRLAVVTVTIPPLRDRRADIPLLARHFLEKYRREIGRERLEFSPDAIEALRAHRWPGNVRELENLVERVAILAEGDRLEPRHLGLDGVAAHPSDVEAFARVVGLTGGLDAVSTRARDLAERLVVERALAECGGNKTRAAQVLDVNYKRLLARIRELGLEEREEEPTKETP
jgi:DNA-binding NtrC family response regulator